MAPSPSGLSMGVFRFDSDPTGTCEVRLQNIVVGSRYRIEVASTGALLASGVAGSTTEDVTIDRYASGNANNSLRIKVRQGSSAPKYQPFETQAESVAGTVLVWIQQSLDTIAA
jgi:hypothetical protein